MTSPLEKPAPTPGHDQFPGGKKLDDYRDDGHQEGENGDPVPVGWLLSSILVHSS